MKRSVVVNLALLAASVFAALVIAELTIGYIVPIRNVGPSFSEYHPTLWKHLKLDFSTVRRTPEFTMRLSTNSFGFRGPAIEALPERPILFLGDSFTMGYGVDDGQEFPALIAADLGRDVAVVNAGIGASGNGRWIKLLREFGNSLSPRLVVMQVMGNDFSDNVSEGLFELTNSGVLVERPVPEPSWRRRAQMAIESVPGLGSTNLVGLMRQAHLPPLTAAADGPAKESTAELDDEQALKLTLAIIEEAVAMCRDRGWPVLAVTIGISEPSNTAINHFFRKYDISVVHLPVKQLQPDLYYKIDGHWNMAGHAEAARQILAEIQHMGVLTPAK